MNKDFFDDLVKDRTESADILEKASMRGVKSSVVDKYSDQAHFVYELLQNADDTKATYARFKLYHDRLVFAHNGTRRFSVSNPSSEDKDRKEGRLGDVNSILSIGHSTKTDKNTIGKFGIGFKAVFQYTTAPHIYDPNIKFKIERFIVPILLENDHKERKAKETLFEFPFNHETNTADIAFKEISDKLSSLVNPILFLSNLKKVSFEFDDTKGYYKTEVERTYTYEDTVGELIVLTQSLDGQNEERKIWLFSRVDESSGRYAVGFYLDENDNLTPVDEYAYCFFPTKENTGLHFIIHAPFLLTNNREGIPSGEKHNQRMIDLLSNLAADCLTYLRDIGIQEKHRLIDDNIVNVVPTRTLSGYVWSRSAGSNPDQRSKYEPFYDKILIAFQTQTIIPTYDSYTSSDNAYWADNLTLSSIFNNDILKSITQNPDAQWVFTSISRDECECDDYNYIDEIVNVCFDEETILDNIEASFIESCTIEWLANFYNWLKETFYTNEYRTLPIFLSSEGKAVPAYDREEKLILFLPTGEESDYTTISKKLLKNKDILAFANHLGITKPSLKSEVETKIIPKLNQIYKSNDIETSRRCFYKLFEYYMECPEKDKETYIEELKKHSFLICSSNEKDLVIVSSNDAVYFPLKSLREYFNVKSSTYFLDWKGYRKLVEKENEKYLRSMFAELGVSSSIKLISKTMSCHEAYARKQYRWHRSTYKESWDENIFDGCSDNLKDISSKQKKERSFLLWSTIIEAVKSQNIDLVEKLKGWHRYYYRTWHRERFDSINVSELRETKWLLDKAGTFVSPSETFATNLSEDYDISSYAARRLIDFLNMPYEDPNLSNLTSEQKKAVEFFNRFRNHGIDTDSLSDDKIERLRDSLQDEITTSDESPQRTNSNSNVDYHHSNSGKNTDNGSSRPKQPRPQTPEIDDDTDSDEYTPKPVDYQKKIEKAKEKSDAELDLLEQLEELQQNALNSERYSYGWFKALLELEAMESNENSSNSREVSIGFGKVEQEGALSRTLILKQPNSYIPPFMEELADIPLILEFENETKKLPIEVISIRSFTLRVKLKPNFDMSNIDLGKVKEARITAENPVFLLKELKKQLAELGLEDSYDMQANLCENIDFIFGPPGTGKTTYLANDVIIPKMKQYKNCKILVLTPTNKAADVIARKIMEVMGADTSYNDWLVRFGSTDDEAIEKSGVFREKTFDLRSLKRIVTITTIDRFPYDFFMPNGERHYLRNQQYDYVIFDEASMIPLVKIIYPLFHNKPKEFIIAGDPFQIEPVVHLDMWKGENIYTMVNLKSFAEHETIHDYKVKLLTTQYRSIPIIGELFSQMTYDGILAHHRKDSDQVNIIFGDDIDVKPLNIIKFPVSKYESIYRPKRLNKTTPYHIYSALFAYEFTLWLANSISQNNPQKNIRIGVIAAYKAQADMIERLILSEKIPEHISVQTGTIHGFQGDECEIIISVYNPPPSISTKPDMFLNKKNIINVSISRARDYLFIVMPDDETENVDNLILIKKMEQLMKESGQYAEYDSHSIEKIMLGSAEYLEENAFSTSHQSVNVYRLPEQKYEIRSEDSAIDIQIHKK